MSIEARHADKAFEFASSVRLDGELPGESAQRGDVVSEYQQSLEDPPMLGWTALKEW